jgi:hypothetical protein
VQLLEPARLASAKELHTTLIRNEAAYFGCVRLLVADHPPPLPTQQALPNGSPVGQPLEGQTLQHGQVQVQVQVQGVSPEQPASPSHTQATGGGGGAPSEGSSSISISGRAATQEVEPLYICGDSHVLSRE